MITELRLSAFKSHRGATFPLDPVTLLSGPSGTGKSSVLEGLAVLGRLASGADLQGVFEVSRTGRSFIRGGAAACVPQDASPDAQGRRGFRIGCTADGVLGPVRLDLAVQVEPTLRIVGERLSGLGETLLTTALRNPARPTVQAAWHTGDAVAVIRAPLPDDRLATPMLPLRVSGSTEGQQKVLAAAEQMVVALRGVFPVVPRPEVMRGPVRVGDGRLRGSCDNLSAVLARTEHECSIRHGLLVGAVREVCSGPVHGLTALPALMTGGAREPLVEAVIAAVDRGGLGMVPVDRLGDGELRFLALALVLLTGPGVLDVDTSTEHLPAGQVLTVVADGLDVGVDRRQARELLRLAGLASARGHIRLLGTVQDPSHLEDAETIDRALLVELGAGSEVARMTRKRKRAVEEEAACGEEGADTAVEGAADLGGLGPGGGPGAGDGGPREEAPCGGGPGRTDGAGEAGAAGPTDVGDAGGAGNVGAVGEAGEAVAGSTGSAGGADRKGPAPAGTVREERVPAQAGPDRRTSSAGAPTVRPPAEPSPSPYGGPPFDRVGHDDFGYSGFGSDESCGYGDAGYDDSGYGDAGYEGPDDRGFEPGDYVHTETVDDVPGHAEPGWLDTAFVPAPAGQLPAGQLPIEQLPVGQLPAAIGAGRENGADSGSAARYEGEGDGRGDDEVDRSV